MRSPDAADHAPPLSLADREAEANRWIGILARRFGERYPADERRQLHGHRAEQLQQGFKHRGAESSATR